MTRPFGMSFQTSQQIGRMISARNTIASSGRRISAIVTVLIHQPYHQSPAMCQRKPPNRHVGA